MRGMGACEIIGERRQCDATQVVFGLRRSGAPRQPRCVLPAPFVPVSGLAVTCPRAVQGLAMPCSGFGSRPARGGRIAYEARRADPCGAAGVCAQSEPARAPSCSTVRPPTSVCVCVCVGDACLVRRTILLVSFQGEGRSAAALGEDEKLREAQGEGCAI